MWSVENDGSVQVTEVLFSKLTAKAPTRGAVAMPFYIFNLAPPNQISSAEIGFPGR